MKQFILKKLPQQFAKRQVSKYCYKLLKLQIPLFDKRMLKNNQSFVKVISDLFCKVYNNYQPDKFDGDELKKQELLRQEAVEKELREEPLKQLYLLEGIRDRKAVLKNYCTQDDVRKINIDFNNYHYWKAEEMKQTIRASLRFHNDPKQTNIHELKHELYKSMWDEVKLPEDFAQNYTQWLDENIWNYYD